MEPQKKRVKLADDLTKARDCREHIRFFPVATAADVGVTDGGFAPLFVHQLQCCTADERISGWMGDLQIDVFYAVDSFHVLVEVSGTPTDGDFDSAAAAVKDSFAKLAAYDFVCFERSAFKNLLLANRNDFKWHAELQETLELEAGTFDFVKRSFVAAETPSNENFAGWHRRIEWMLKFFIDAASDIEVDDRWEIFLALKVEPAELVRRDSLSTDNLAHITRQAASRPTVSVAGFASVYTYFGIPNCRRRVSQFFVPVPFQGRHIGFHLLRLLHCDAIDRPEICEINVEDPAVGFRQMRDYVDLYCGIERGIFTSNDVICGEAPVEVDMDRVRSLKEGVLQSFRLREILRLAAILPSQEVVIGEKSAKPRDSIADRPMSTKEAFNHSIQSRAHRRLPWYSEVRDWASNDTVRGLRLDVKRRLLTQQFDDMHGLPPAEVREKLQSQWVDLFCSYARTVWKLRSQLESGRLATAQGGV